MAKKEPNKANIVGIDLGTTFSALAILNGIGKPEIVPNADGERLTPSAIFFDEENSDVVRVGIEAVNSRLVNAQRSIRWIKRHMGDANYHKNIDGVNEPVAAALYYATTRDVSGKVLVYDLGGGTFDVTIMDVEGHQMQIVCSQGDHALGGTDFDQKILEIMEKSYTDKFGAGLITSDEDRAKYEDDAEDIKKTLSRRLASKKMLYGPAGNMRVEIKREMFEENIASLIARTDILVEVVLDEAGLKPSDIGKVLLVGGSTRIPLVQKHLEKTFGFKPETAVNVDECVALGAALQAGLTMLREKPEEVSVGISSGLKDINLTDVCNHSYGTICAPVDNETGRRVIQNCIILKKNTPLPCQASQMFYTVSEGQTELEVTISQGEDSAPEYVTKIATHKFQLPPGRPAERPIKVTYSYDVNQRMHCKFEDVESGTTLEVDCSLDKKGDMSEKREKGKRLEDVKVK